ncbi:13021_t:CDS:2, partial [Acaulospora morrowiae]
MSVVNFALDSGNTVLQQGASVSTYQDMFTPSESSPRLLGEMENVKTNDNVNDRQDVHGIHNSNGSGHMITNNGNVQPPYQLADNINSMIQFPYYFDANSSVNPFE